jgi:putative ABC transport system substrate-binding protein
MLADLLLVKEAQGAAPALGLTIQPLAVRASGDLGPAFEEMTREHAQAVFIGGSSFAIAQKKSILGLAARRRLPVISQWREFADSGALMCYGPSIADMFRRAAYFVDKILKGAKPGDLPVEQPTKFELVVNLKTAKALGLTIPPSVLARADEVIE